jgi:mycobactin peptide synthetase MbtE
MPPAVLTGPAIDYAHGDRIEQVLIGHAETRPAAPALRWHGQVVTYRQLVDRASQVAAGLVEAGVQRGDVVTVWRRLDPDLVATLLGVLMAGGVYSGLPVDWPMGRVVECVRACDSRVIVSDLPAAGAQIAGVPVVLPKRGNGIGSVGGNAPFCVFMTSGSTGRPKAVASPHRGIVRLAYDELLALSAETVSLVRAPIAWDGFAVELWLPLLLGGTCVLGEAGALSTEDVRGLVAQGVNYFFLPTSLFGAIVEDGVDSLAGVRTLLVGGERMAAEHAVKCVKAHPDLRLVNGYGPVEGCAYVTGHLVGDEGGEIPIGTAAPNTTIYLLDENRQPVALGERGEIAVAGDSVALGYLGDEAATAAKFPSLNLDGENVRVYLTGDLAEADDNGVLRFVGRADRQVKLRGARIELNEVERALDALPGVGTAVVVGLPRSGPVTTSLAAFYQGPDADQVRAALAEALPAAYLPDMLLPVDPMPLTGNGKADLDALCALLPSSQFEADGPLGTVLRAATDLLGFTPQPDEDLFAQGASSLTAVRLANRVKRDLACELSGADVLAARTITKLLALIAERPRTAAPVPTVERDDGPTRIQSAFRFLEQATPGSDDLLIPVVYRIRGEVDANRLRQAIHAVAAEHDALRTKLSMDLRTGKVSAALVSATELPDLLTVAEPVESEVDALDVVTKFTRRLPRLDREVPLKAILQPCGVNDYVLGIATHHVALDGWSLERLARAIGDRYQGVAGPTESTSYAQVFAAQQQTPANIAEWRERLDGIPAPAIGRRLGVIRPGPVREVRLDLPAQRDMADWAARTDRTPFTGYLAAYACALHTVFGIDAVPVNLPVVGRTSPESEAVLGPFSNNVVVGLRNLGAGPEVVAAAAAEQMRAVLDSQLLDFDEVLDGLAPRSESWNTFYQVNFVVQENSPAVLTLPPAMVEHHRIPPRASTMKLRMELFLTGEPHGVLAYRTDCVRDEEARGIAEAWSAGVRALLRAEPRNV